MKVKDIEWNEYEDFKWRALVDGVPVAFCYYNDIVRLYEFSAFDIKTQQRLKIMGCLII